jgi:hypothetical protein
VLKVVEHEQQVLVAQIALQARDEGAIGGLIDAKGLGNAHSDQARIADRGKLDKVHTIVKLVEQAGPGLDGEARLANTRRADERDHAVGIGQQTLANSGYLPIAPDQWGRRLGQIRVAVGPGAPGGKLGGRREECRPMYAWLPSRESYKGGVLIGGNAQI